MRLNAVSTKLRKAILKRHKLKSVKRQFNRSKIASIAIVGFAYFAAYWPTLRSLYGAWIENSDNTHGIFVPVISAYLVWEKREELAQLSVKSSSIWLPALFVSILLYLTAFAGGVEVLQRLTIVTTLLALVGYNLGHDYIKSLWFPICFLFFMIPPPVSIVNTVAFPLQVMATKISAHIISAFGIPVFREGNMLYFSNTSLEVAEACSGLRSLYAYLMLSALFAYIGRRSATWKVLLLGLAVPLALSMNIIRISITGILAYFYGAKVARGFLHEFSGVVIFIAGFCVMVLLHLKIGAPRHAAKVSESH